MSLRGVGKALYRTPHQLFGQKSTEDATIKLWEHDIKTAVAGLEYLKLENSKWKEFWDKTMSNFILVVEIFSDLHCSLENVQSKNGNGDSDNKSADKNEEFAGITIHELEQASKLANIMYNKVTSLSNESSEIFISRCNEMIKTIKGVEKLITKRNHKKIDYDMQIKKFESLLKGSVTTDKEKEKLESHKQSLSESEIIFKDLNEKMKLIIPEVLSNLSEFINKLLLKLYFTNSDILKFVQKNLTKFTRVHGIIPTSTALTYEEIINDFNTLNSQAQNRLQELELLNDFRSMREKNLGEKTKEQVNSVAGTVVDSTVNFTSTLYTKASKPNQKLSVSLTSFKIDNPVKPYKQSGMFTTALDPIAFIKHTDYANELSELDLQNPSLDSPLTDLDYSVKNEKEEDNLSLAESTNPSVNPSNDNWMKPLKNSTLNKALSPPQSSTDISSNTDNMSLNSMNTSHNTTFDTLANRISSLNLNSNSETYKYVNITADNITKQLYFIVTNPDIDHAPITIGGGKLTKPDKNITDYITAKSSITANAFAAYSSI